MIRAILACDNDWGIGRNNDLPWPHNPADLAWFKQNTLNSSIVMGRNTWESLPFKPLPKRHNAVVSSTMQEQPDVEVVRPDIYKSRLATMSTTENVWIIGGSQLINNSLGIIDEIWLSRIDGTHNCDVFLPKELIETTFELVSSEHEGEVYVDKWRAY